MLINDLQTMLQALQLKGGHENALTRIAVAAYLNSWHYKKGCVYVYGTDTVKYFYCMGVWGLKCGSWEWWKCKLETWEH